MKKYIFITTPIYTVGGSQTYTAAKANYLESIGWDVHVIAPNRDNNNCIIKSLSKYIPDTINCVGLPPFAFKKSVIEKVLNRMVNFIGKYDYDDEIIIESHEDTYAFWGEMLAERLKAKHFFYTMNEHYRLPNQYFDSKIDFFKFKMQRREIMGSVQTLSRIFDGYLKIKESDAPDKVIINEAPVQDIECDKLDLIKQADLTIAYLGTGLKPYVQNIISEVGVFAANHPEMNIQFVCISDFSYHKKILDEILLHNSNLSFIELGYLFPIPKKFFSKIDIMIAGSGSARHSAVEGVPTIIADPEHKQANGYLGYETSNAFLRDTTSVVSTFSEAIERGLGNNLFKDRDNHFKFGMSVAESTKQNFELFAKSVESKEYYESEQLMIGKVKTKYKTTILAYVLDFWPNFIGSLVCTLIKFMIVLIRDKNWDACSQEHGSQR